VSANLVRNPEFTEMAGALPAEWRTRSPRNEVAPRFSLGRDGETGMPVLRSEFPRGAKTFGQWETVVSGLEAGRAYSFSVEASWTGIASATECVRLKVAWLAGPEADGDLRKELAAPARRGAGPWRRMEIVGVAPEGATAARMELVSRWSPSGKVLWREPAACEADPPQPREVVLAAAVGPRGETPEANRAEHLRQARAAAEAGAEIIVLAEAFPRAGTGLSSYEAAEPLEGPTLQAMAGVSRETGAYIAGGIDELDGGVLYNTMLLVGPVGLVGRYRKTHLPEAECIGGVTPGEEYPVFETPLGRIGLEICYDNFFPEVARSLAVGGAEIILCSIAGDGREGGMNWEVVSRARAIDNSVAFAAAIWPPGRSLVVNQWGHVLADSGGEPGFITASVDLAERRWKQWMSVTSWGEWAGLWRHERRPRTYGPLGMPLPPPPRAGYRKGT